MKLRCKPGDLAFVVKAHVTPAMLGRVVRVVRRAVPGEKFLSVCGKWELNSSAPQLPSWVVEHDEPMAWGIRSARFKQRVFADIALLPIRPGDLDDDTDADEVIVMPVEHEAVAA